MLIIVNYFIFAKTFGLKIYTAYFFVLLYILAMTRPVLPLLDYVMNKDFIVEVLCVNKDNTKLNCEGKCYLMQQLKAQESNKKSNTPKKISLEEYPIGFIYLTSFNKIPEIQMHTSIDVKYTKNYHYIYYKNTLKPPINLS